MAYISQDEKAKIAPVVKSLLKQYGLKGTLSIRNHSTICLTISAGTIDFFASANRMNKKAASWRGDVFREVKDEIQVNPYYSYQNSYVLAFLLRNCNFLTID